jgi:4'-phosphopantetheinyl transferase
MGIGYNEAVERGASVEVWIASPTAIDASARELLDTGEHRRLALFRRERDRQNFVASRVLVRTALSAHAPVAPERWAFELGAHGRPEIAAGLCDRPLRFNLSHTAGLVACAVTIGRDVGIDVEWRRRSGNLRALAERYFAPQELAELAALSEPRFRERFFDYWTLKEAYVKARGLGLLSLPLRQVAFTLDPPRLAFDPGWQFARLEPTADHVLALAVRRDSDPELSIHVHPLDHRK